VESRQELARLVSQTQAQNFLVRNFQETEASPSLAVKASIQVPEDIIKNVEAKLQGNREIVQLERPLVPG